MLMGIDIFLTAEEIAEFCSNYSGLSSIAARKITESAKRRNLDSIRIYYICTEKIRAELSY